MMELRCVNIFLLFCVVSATPHGYGTKGGASAKAEASATAGAFGGIKGLPLSIPTGSGYSGSYSKSSASSFSSASSSASSSSSSYSYSGSGTAGAPHFGANGIAEAKSVAGANAQLGTKEYAGINNPAGSNGFLGTSSNVGANGLEGTSGFTGAHATAGSNSLAGLNSPDGATSLAGAHSLAGGTTGCASGACSHNKADGLSNLHGSSGTAINHGYGGANAAAASKNTAETYDFTNGGGKTCVGSDCLNVATNNKCTTGQCGFESLKKHEDCSSGKCVPIPQTGPASPNYQPSPHCTSGQCGLNTQANLPTLPSYGYNDIPAKRIDTTSSSGSKGHFADKALPGYHSTSSDSSSESSEETTSQNHSGYLDNHNQDYGNTKCDTPNCKGYTGTVPFSGSGLPGSYTKPESYLTTPKVHCNSPSCQSDLSISGGRPSSYNVPLQTTFDGPKQELPCANGNCGNNQFKNTHLTEPVGCTSPTCIGQHPFSKTSGCNSPHCGPHFASAPIENGNGLVYQPGLAGSVSIPKNPSYASSILPTFTPSNRHVTSGCNAPGCTGFKNIGSDSGAHSQNGFLPVSSSPVLPSYSIPVFTPNTQTLGHSQLIPSNTGNYDGVSGTPVVTPGQKPPTGSYGQSFGGPIGILKPNEFNVPTNTHILPPSHTGPSNSNKPNIGAPPAEELPPYTGGFGGPQGLLKPNEFDVKHPSTSLNTPASNVNPSEKDRPKYTGGFGAPGGLLKPNEVTSSSNVGAPTNSNSGIFSTTSPHIGVTNPIGKVPPHHGTYGAPSGSLQPPATGPAHNLGITPGVHVGSPIVLQPTPAAHSAHQTLPPHTGGLVPPIGSIQPNTYFSYNPATGPNASVGHIDSHGHTQSVSGESSIDKVPKYTGGFGGPAGVPKPNGYKDSSSTGYQSSELPINGIKPTACSSGTCNVKSSNAVAVAKADAVAYTGGFGGPSGLLIPHDSGKLDSKLLPNVQTGINHDRTTSGNSDMVLTHGTHSQSSASAQANAGAHASAAAGTTSGSFGNNDAYSKGQTGSYGGGLKVEGGCGGGCGGGGHYGGESNFGSSSALGTAKAVGDHGSENGLHSSVASAKSIASAVSGAGAFSGAESYASSSASAQASAGYGTKGGYGK